MDEKHDPGFPSGWGQAIGRVLHAAATLPPNEMLRTATEVITDRLGDRGSCVLLGAEDVVLVCTEGRAIEGVAFRLHLYPEVIDAVRTKKAVYCDDVRLDSRLDDVRDNLPAHVGSVSVIPIVVDGRAHGAFLVRSANPHRPSHEDREIAEVVAQLAGTLAHGAGFFSPDARFISRNSTPVSGVTIDESTTRDLLLVVDDEQDVRDGLAEILEEEGFEVCTVADGGRVAEIAAQRNPTAILLDVLLPGASGFEIAEQLSADRRTASVAIIYMSGVEDLPARVRSQNRSQDDFLRKPFSPDEMLVRVRRAVAESWDRRALNHEANTDDLTGLGNLRLLRARLQAEESRISRYRTTLSVVVADLDRLKRINDDHGHLVGSEVIRRVGKALREEARGSDVVARYGGDEFVVLLPHAPLVEAGHFADRILERIRQLDFDGFGVTASLGVATHAPGIDARLEDTLARADAAAYGAKREGGDRVRLDTHPTRIGRTGGNLKEAVKGR